MDFKHPVKAVIPGTQSRILTVLAQTTAALNLRTVARLADVSPAQASRVQSGLVERDLVERQKVAPSSLFSMNFDNIATRRVIQIARSRDLVLEQMGMIASELPTQPKSVTIFGSFARHEAERLSDIDAVFILPTKLQVNDDVWIDGMEQCREQVNRLPGNRVEVVEVKRAEVSRNWQAQICFGTKLPKTASGSWRITGRTQKAKACQSQLEQEPFQDRRCLRTPTRQKNWLV